MRTQSIFFFRWGVSIYWPSRCEVAGGGDFFFRGKMRQRGSWEDGSRSFYGTCLSYNNKIILSWVGCPSNRLYYHLSNISVIRDEYNK